MLDGTNAAIKSHRQVGELNTGLRGQPSSLQAYLNDFPRVRAAMIPGIAQA